MAGKMDRDIDHSDTGDTRDTADFTTDTRVDPLRAFLDADPSNAELEEVWLAGGGAGRAGTVVTVKAISDSRRYHTLVQQCTERQGIRGREREKFNGPRFNRLLVVHFLDTPAFHPSNDDGRGQFEALAEKYGTSDPETLVERAFLVGEIDKMSETILRISGFDTEVATAGN